MEKEVERRRELRERTARDFANSAPHRLKDINEFRSDVRYGNDGTRVDLAYAIYALAHGSSVDQIEAALRSRDLSHKGSEKRQDDYIERTIKKAVSTVEKYSGGLAR